MVTQLTPQTTAPWYGQDPQQVLDALHSSLEGLSEEEARLQLERCGPNALPEVPPRSQWALLVDQFRSGPVALLTVAAGLSVVTSGLVDALVIMGVVLINGVIGYATESQSERIIRSLEHLSSPAAVVKRGGQSHTIDPTTVVPGDILVLRPGAYVAADGRLLVTQELSMDESALTGESLPVLKTAETLTGETVPLGDRTNMVYRGTLVTGGQGLAIVTATAAATEVGQIQALVGEFRHPPTPMEHQLDQAGSQLVWLSSAVCAVVFGLGLLRGYPLLDMLKTSVALAVAAVPEGLPAVATTTLALGILAMRRQRVLIRRLDAVETLGSLQTLCLDKTGTLTTNHMAVVELQTDHTRLRLADLPAAGETPWPPETAAPIVKLLQVIVLCNESQVEDDNGEPSFTGSSTENALLAVAMRVGLDVSHLRQAFPRLAIQHRSAQHNHMATLHPVGDGAYLIAVKGSPLEVLAQCDRRLDQAGTILLTEAMRQSIIAENDRMASEGLRVLGVAYGQTTSPHLDQKTPLIWLGLVALADPIRPGMKEIIASFHQAGIETVMVTGDQRSTAAAIGKALNLSQGEALTMLEATDLSQLAPDQAKALCQRVHVFARISPANKLQVVQALQRAGKVVAMTGDGINDTPALKVAEVGIAMGQTGTDAAHEVADVILEDDNLATLTLAIEQGRTIYSNIRKAVHFLLSTNLSEIMVMFAGLSLGLGQPLNALQLLWLNLVTDIFPGLALALEPSEPGILTQPPRKPDEAIIQPATLRRMALEAVVISISALVAYGDAVSRYGIGAQASTIGFMGLTLAQLLHALSCRSERRCVFGEKPLPPNRYLAIALTLSITLQCLALVIRPLGTLLHIVPLLPRDALVVAGSALLPLLVNEWTKPRTANLVQESGRK